MATNDLLMYLVYWRQPDLPKAVDNFVAWLERNGSVDAIRRFSEWKNKRSAYPLNQLLAGKMSEDEARRYCCFGLLLWAEKERENLVRNQISVIKQKQVGLLVANAERRFQDEFTLTKMSDDISTAQAQLEEETRTAWQRSLADNTIEVGDVKTKASLYRTLHRN